MDITFLRFDLDGFCKLQIDGISCILDRYDTAALEMGDDSNRLSAVAPQRKQERIHFLIVGYDLTDDIFFSLFRIP